MAFRVKTDARAILSAMKDTLPLVVRLDRLPDISTVRDLDRYGYRNYGRFAVLRDGDFWVQTLHSSYPAEMETGWFWAVDAEDRLIVSARGAISDGESLFGRNKPILARLIEELVKQRIIRRPQAIKVA